MNTEHLLLVEHSIIDELETIASTTQLLSNTPLCELQSAIDKIVGNVEHALTTVAERFAELKDGVN